MQSYKKMIKREIQIEEAQFVSSRLYLKRMDCKFQT
jgi:hypothetical protein